jgi:hypothetical protein
MIAMMLLASVRKRGGGSLAIMWFLCDQLYCVEKKILLGEQLNSSF